MKLSNVLSFFRIAVATIYFGSDSTNVDAAPGDCFPTNSAFKTELTYYFISCETNPNCATVLTWGNIGDWCTSLVTDMNNLFAFKTGFNKDISRWDTSRVTNMAYMFWTASNFNQNLSGWNTQRVTSMEGMFYGADIFNADISKWNTSHVTTMQSMFLSSGAFNQDISGWNTASVTSMLAMFDGAIKFNRDISHWNTARVNDMSHIFQDAMKFNQDVSLWNTARVTDMQSMFAGTQVFNQNISGWNTSSVTDMEWMFNNALAFNQDISVWNIASVTTMRNMFNGAIAFDQDLCDWKENFPYSSATDVFINSGCTYKDTPADSSSAFCGSLCVVPVELSALDQLSGKSITSTCFINDTTLLLCSASTDASVSGGIIKTSLAVGNCSATHEESSIEGSSKSVELTSDLSCKNQGACAFKHCFRADYFIGGISILANMTEISSNITYKKDGSFTVVIQTAEFAASSNTLDASVAKNVTALLGECGMNAQTAPLEIGEAAAICISNGDSSIKLNLASVQANPGGQILVDSDGVPNFITELINDGTNQVTLKTLMIPAYFDAQNGNAGSITINGTALISYTNRQLFGGRALTGTEESHFTLAVPLSHAKDPAVSQHTMEKDENAGNHLYLNVAAVAMLGAIFVWS